MCGLLSIAPLASVLLASATPAQFEASYLYKLSDTFGALNADAPVLTYDPKHHELYMVGEGLARVFNESGMEVFTFGDDPEIGTVHAVVALDDGDLIIRSWRGGKLSLVRANFRGEFISEIQPRGVPAGFEGALGGPIRHHDGKLYLLDPGGMRVLVLDVSGAFVAAYDIAEKLELSEKRAETGIRGFNVDPQGNVLFTIQPLFRAYVMSPAGEIQEFGTKGGAPGKFNVVSGIARDEDGYFYVADILKSVVIVFDRDFVFLREFGYRGGKPGSLAAPEELAVRDGKLFVSQHARRGVSVFKVAQREASQ